jgi:hypothetical protein
MIHMRKSVGLLVSGFLTVLFLLPAAGYAQIWGGQDAAAVDQAPPGAKSAAGSAGKFDPHDFTGVWLTNHRGTDGYRGMTKEGGIPPRTPWAEGVFKSRLTGRITTEKEAVPPAFGNDPIMECNPYGFPRLLFYTDPVEFFNAPGRLIMFFQGQRNIREIWMDGRSLPKDPDKRWLGYSVGKWEGDTLVVDSSGFDGRAWLDQYGNVYSDDMHFQERWKRTGPDTLEVVYRLDDPKAYAKPWVSTVKTYKKQARGEIREQFCAPVDEKKFNDTIRDPAGGLGKK